MAVYKNVASQKIAVLAWDTSADAPKTGDAANITAQISKDGGATAQTNDVNPTELDATDAPGIYLFDLAQAETDGDLLILYAVSATTNIKIEPAIIYTLPGTNTGLTPDAAGVRTAVGLAAANLDGQLSAIDDAVDAEVAAVLAAVDTEVAAIKAKTDNLPADPADASDIAALFVTVNSKLDAIDDFLDTEITAILADTTELADTVLADSVPADGSLGTLKQTLYEIRQFLFEFSISSTTGTSKKADGTTTLETFTTNSATTPTSITRSG